MKMTSKLIYLLIAFLLSASAVVYAQNGKPEETPKTDSFCLKISDLKSKADQLISKRLSDLNLKGLEGRKKLGEKRTEIDQKLGENRKKWDKNREEQYAKLLEKADTDVKKQALLKFQNEVETAVANRRAAINTAQNAYRDGINQLLNSRKEKIDELAEKYKKIIEDALLKAEAGCKSGAKTTVRVDLLNALKNARQEFNADKQGLEKLGSQVKTFVETRKTAFEKAKADFKTALEKAKSDLKTAFGDIKASPSPQATP